MSAEGVHSYSSFAVPLANAVICCTGSLPVIYTPRLDTCLLLTSTPHHQGDSTPSSSNSRLILSPPRPGSSWFKLSGSHVDHGTCCLICHAADTIVFSSPHRVFFFSPKCPLKPWRFCFQYSLGVSYTQNYAGPRCPERPSERP